MKVYIVEEGNVIANLGEKVANNSLLSDLVELYANRTDAEKAAADDGPESYVVEITVK